MVKIPDILIVFKTEHWKWKRNIVVENFLSVNIWFLSHFAAWPLDYTVVLPQSLKFLSPYIHRFYYIFCVFISFHMAVLCLYTSVFLMIYSKNASLTDISSMLVETILYSCATFFMSYFYFRHDKCLEINNFIKKTFKMRSSVGKKLSNNNEVF